MRNWLRRIRGAVGMGVTWAAGWAPLGAILGFFTISTGVASFGSVPLWIAATSAFLGASGFLCGIAFSTVLGITEGRREFDQMSLPRFAGWGAIGGFLVGGLLVTLSASWGGAPNLFDFLVNMGVVGLLGAGSSAGSLALARRAEGLRSLKAGEDDFDVGLTEGDERGVLSR